MDKPENEAYLEQKIKKSILKSQLSNIPVLASAGTICAVAVVYSTESEMALRLKIATDIIFSGAGIYFLNECRKSYKSVRSGIENLYNKINTCQKD